MNKKELGLLIGNIILFVIFGSMFIFDFDVRLSLQVIFGALVIGKLGEFLLNIKDKDYENLCLSLISLGVFIILFWVKLINKNLVLVFLIWLGLGSLVKLKKADYYHDRENVMWIYKIVNLFSFLSLGLIISLNLNFPIDVNGKMLVLFFMFNSVLDVIEPFVLYIIRGNK